MMNKLEGLCDRLWACAQWHEESAAELVGFGHEQHIRFATLLREAAAELKAAREDGHRKIVDLVSLAPCTPKPPVQNDSAVQGFLRLPAVLRLIPVSRSTWWDGVRRGRFPAAVKLTTRTTAWRVQDIRELIERIENGEAQ